MDIQNITEAIIMIIAFIGIVILSIVWGFVVFILSLYAAAYTVALLHISFVTPTIFDTHSLFTIPYNEIWTMASMYPFFYWPLTIVYFIIGLKQTSNKKSNK